MNIDLTETLISWFPMIALIVVWIVFSSRWSANSRKVMDVNEKILIQQTRVADFLEEIKNHLTTTSK
jgi:hypothetical protein